MVKAHDAEVLTFHVSGEFFQFPGFQFMVLRGEPFQGVIEPHRAEVDIKSTFEVLLVQLDRYPDMGKG